MKIVQLAGLAGPDAVAGGVWRVAETQTAALSRAGHHPRLIAGWWGDPIGVDSSASRLVRAQEMVPGGGLRLLRTPTLRNALKSEVIDATVAHVHLARDFITVPALRSFVTSRTPIVAQTHGMLRRKPELSGRLFDLMYRRRILRAVTLWLALTDREVGELLDFGVPPERIRLIPNSVVGGTGSWTQPSRPHFAFVSRFHARKQPAVLVRASERLFDEGYEFDVTLAGPDEGAKAEVTQMVSRSPYRDRFTIANALSSEAVAQTLSSVTAVVLPSRDEVAPMIALEASASGTPLVLTDDCGLAAEYAQAAAAEIVEPTTVGVANGMRKLLSDPGLVARLSTAGRRLFDARWSEGALVSALESSYATARELSR